MFPVQTLKLGRVRLDRQGQPQQLRHFFLDVDDELGFFELMLQVCFFTAQAGEFIFVVAGVRLCTVGLGIEASLLLLFAEVVESGVVDAFSAQDGGDLSSLGAGIDQAENAQFLFAAVAASDWLGLGPMRL